MPSIQDDKRSNLLNAFGLSSSKLSNSDLEREYLLAQNGAVSVGSNADLRRHLRISQSDRYVFNGATLGTPYSDHVLASNPYAYYKLDELSGDYLDYSPNARHATVTDTTPSLNRDVVGAITSESPNRAVSKPQTGTLIQTPAGATGTAVTFEGWVKLNQAPAASHQYLVFFSGAKKVGVVAYRNATGNRFALWDSDSFWHDSNFTVSFDTWTYLAVVVNGLDTTFFQNGVQLNTVTKTLPIEGTSYTALTIGSTELGNEGVFGSIDSVAVYLSALSATTIAERYALATAA